MIKKNLILDFQRRHLIAQITHQKILEKKLNSEVITMYCGFDPTSDSLHIGHLMPLLCLKRFQLYGHRPIVVIGGATGLIGDPSFKKNKRQFHSIDTIEKWTKKIKKQISLFLNCHDKHNAAIIVNNYDWFSSINILDFLRNIGKNFSVNRMINKEAIKQRLIKNNSGLSFTEFSYNLLQSYDFTYLHKNYNAILQIGGSDQWGNIISGIDLTRRMYQKNVYGLTLPLITKKDNTKFGKTENDTIWLDKTKTSPYNFYQFWINTHDNNVYSFLRFFTFLDITQINALELENKNSNNTLRHQRVLAKELTYLVHGKQELKIAQEITKNLFKNEITKFTIEDFIQLKSGGIPTTTLKIKKMNIKEILIISKLASSNHQARILIQSNTIVINGNKKVQKETYTIENMDRIHNQYTLLQRGKKHFFLIQWKY